MPTVLGKNEKDITHLSSANYLTNLQRVKVDLYITKNLFIFPAVCVCGGYIYILFPHPSIILSFCDVLFVEVSNKPCLLAFLFCTCLIHFS